MPNVTLTDSLIKSLIAWKKKGEYWDKTYGCARFGLRITANGIATFMIRYLYAGRHARYSIGHYPTVKLADARRAATKLAGKILEGKDPQLEKVLYKKAETVDELFEVYFAHSEDRIAPRTLKQYQGNYERLFKKTIGKIKANELGKGHVIPILEKLGKKAPTQSERARALLMAVMNYAVSLDLIEFNPLLKLPKFGRGGEGDRYLSQKEIKSYLEAVSNLSAVEKVYFRLLLMLGMRPGELARLKWEFIENDIITIPGAYQKNKRVLSLTRLKYLRNDWRAIVSSGPGKR